MLRVVVIAAVLTLIAVAVFAAPASKCFPKEAFFAALKDHGQEIRTMGMMGEYVLLTAASEDGRWTVLSISADGVACLKATGNDFVVYPPKAPGDDM